jgi:hypothetical protein
MHHRVVGVPTYQTHTLTCLAATLAPPPFHPLPFHPLADPTLLQDATLPLCRYWDPVGREWSSRGLVTLGLHWDEGEGAAPRLHCASTHLTAFTASVQGPLGLAFTLNVVHPIDDAGSLEVRSVACCGVLWCVVCCAVACSVLRSVVCCGVEWGRGRGAELTARN